MNTDYYLGIDWGGTRIKLGAVTQNAEFIAQDIFQPLKNATVETTIASLIDKTAELIQQIGKPPLGIGLALTGPVDPDLGVVLLPGKIKGLEQYPIVPQFQKHFNLPVRALNDGTASIYAEKYAGKAKDKDWAVTITIGTGIGSGVMLDGKILDDPSFMFGSQLGHLIMDTSNDALCLTGMRGTGEMLCSATALAQSVKSGLQRGIPSTLTEKYQTDPHSIDFLAVIKEGVEKNDALCIDELRRWTTKLGWLVANAIHAYSPQVVILSGGATLAADHYLSKVQDHVNQHIFRYPRGKEVPILISDITEHSGVLGAAMMIQLFLTRTH